MEYGTRTGVGHNERRDNTVPNPHAKPRLPPRKPKLDHGRDDHPSAHTVSDRSKAGKSRLTYVLMLKLSAIQLHDGPRQSLHK